MPRSPQSRLASHCAAAIVLTLLSVFVARAHPNESSAHSMRTLVRMSENGLHVMVVLEIPINDVMGEFRKRLVDTGMVDPNNIEQQHIDQFNRLQWSRLDSGLKLTVNGHTPAGSWSPVDTPINGKANAGFFVYLLWYESADPDVDLGNSVAVEVDNQAFPAVKMYLSGYADSRTPWRIAENSAEELLGAGAQVREANEEPSAWTQDPAMRRLRVVYTQAE